MQARGKSNETNDRASGGQQPAEVWTAEEKVGQKVRCVEMMKLGSLRKPKSINLVITDDHRQYKEFGKQKLEREAIEFYA